MPRYYESESLIDFVKNYTPHINGETTMECVERAIRNAPTVDVDPKTEGEWVVTENGCVITCSECGYRLELCYPDGTEVRSLPACPICGVKMKGGN